MNTGIGRFILRLGTGLLAFMIGVTVAWALGGINPFQSFSGTRYYRPYKRHCNYRGSVTLQPAFEENVETLREGDTLLLKSPRGRKLRKDMSELPPPPPPPIRAAPELR